MISRSEKNKKLNKKINYEKTLNISKKIIKILFIFIFIFSTFFLYSYFIGIKGININEYIIKDNIPNSFNGIKIMHFSDLLYDKTMNKEYLSSLLDKIKLTNPDIVIFTGNLINKNYKIQEEDIINISSFMKNIPYRLGKYAVKGNYDTSNFDLIMDNTNFTILDNEVLTIYNDFDDYINICGININKNDTISLKNDNYTITLINNYDMYSNYNIKSNLVLAGNNLGGEIRLFNIPLLANNKYMNNFYKDNNANIYISNGLGSIHHMRFMNHPSINVFRIISYN